VSFKETLGAEMKLKLVSIAVTHERPVNGVNKQE
jgi:hypothetical protein